MSSLPPSSLLGHVEEGPHPAPHLHRPHLLQAAGLGGRGRVESQHGAARGGQDRPQVGGGAEGLGGGGQAESVAQATGKLTLQRYE
jgi:hypothetical protein